MTCKEPSCSNHAAFRIFHNPLITRYPRSFLRGDRRAALFRIPRSANHSIRAIHQSIIAVRSMPTEIHNMYAPDVARGPPRPNFRLHLRWVEPICVFAVNKDGHQVPICCSPTCSITNFRSNVALCYYLNPASASMPMRKSRDGMILVNGKTLKGYSIGNMSTVEIGPR